MFGVRKVCVIGAFVSAAGLGLASLSTELWHMFVAYGVVAGIGFSMIVNTGITVVNQWFEKRRCVASALVWCFPGQSAIYRIINS